MNQLHPGASLATDAHNDCVPTAIALATGVSAAKWLERLRARDPKCCTKRRGTSSYDYVAVLREAGYRVTDLFQGNIADTVPLHVACAMLKGRVGVMVVRSGRWDSHLIAAQGFMLADNGRPTPRWWADFLALWDTKTRYKYVVGEGWKARTVHRRTRAQVCRIYVIEREAA